MIELFELFPAVFVGCAAVLGLLVGSFLNVVILRLPVMLERRWRADALALDGKAPEDAPPFDLIRPRSCCPGCKTPISALQNIPVLSYLFLRGRCGGCARPIGLRYPLYELASGIASALVAWKFGPGLACAAALLLTWFLIALAGIDLDTQLLPDDLTLPLLWIGLAANLLLPAAVPGSTLPVDLHSAVIGALAGYLSLWSLFHVFRLLTGKEGMGYGDFKLLAALGAWLGWQMLLPIVLGAAAVGAIVGISLILLRRHEQGVPIPFGPFLAAAGWLALLFGREIVDGYLGLFVP
jgi:leader peptidase (prepilin peptidase)/N-methyltransferase